MGALVSLTVVLAALAVVVVAGAPPAHTRVVVRTTVTHLYVPVLVSRGAPSAEVVARGGGRPGAASGTGAPATTTVAPPTRRASTSVTTTTTSTSTATTTVTTTTTVPTVTTTTVASTDAPQRRSRDGVFEGGAVTASVTVGQVEGVEVSVPAGLQVTLSVTCGLTTWPPVTSMTSAVVHVLSGGASCTATFRIPSSSPQPAHWVLVTS